jgi:hypothetical protein
MKAIVFVLFALCVTTYTLHRETQLSQIEYTKYNLSGSDQL